jgi:hypothetical protein
LDITEPQEAHLSFERRHELQVCDSFYGSLAALTSRFESHPPQPAAVLVPAVFDRAFSAAAFVLNGFDNGVT